VDFVEPKPATIEQASAALATDEALITILKIYAHLKKTTGTVV